MGAQGMKLCGEMAMRAERRRIEQRSEPRREDVVDCSTLFFRGGIHLVPVVNISSRGAMIESDIDARIGESVIIRFEGCSPIYAAVRWVRGGRVGLGFGKELTIG
jgi:hypothetical protein